MPETLLQPRAERIPPANIEAELGVLGSILLDGDALHEVLPILVADDFYRDEHQQIYRVIRDLANRGQPVDIILLNEELVRCELFDAVGGNAALVEIVESTPHAANARFYTDLVRQKAIARDVIAAGTEAIRLGYSHDYSGEEMAERAEQAMFAIGDRRTSHRIVTIGEAARGAMKRLGERQLGVFPGVPTGLNEFDNLTGGLQPGHLVVLAARPSIGKTSLGLNIADHVATNLGIGTLFISLEMTGEELGDRALCARAGVDGRAFALSAGLSGSDGPGLSGSDERALARAVAQFAESRLFIDDAPAQAVDRICAMGRRYRARERIGLLAIDYLQLVEAGDSPRFTPRHELVGRMTRALKNLAKSLDIPVLLLAQLNREVEKREDKKPQLSDLRESGDIEQDANMVLLLHRPEFYDKANRPGEADLIIAKNRGGPTRTVRLRYNAPTTRFTDWDEPLPPGHELAEAAY